MASVWLLPIFVVIVGFLTVGGSLWFVIYLNKQARKIDVPPNAPIIDTTTKTQFTNGYSLGVLKSEVPCKNGTHRIEFYPLDNLQGETQPKPEMQCVIVAKEMVNRFARGDRSSRRERIDILPRSNFDLPDKMRETKEGEIMTQKGQLAHIEKVITPAIAAGDEAIAMAMSHLNRTGVASATLAQMKEELAQANKQLVNGGNVEATESSKK